MQVSRDVRRLVVLALAACSESTQERVERLQADAEVTCWTYHCDDGPYASNGAPTMSTDEGVSCMNDALASGKLAVASWSTDNFRFDSTANTYMFTVDHQVLVFTSTQHGPDLGNFQEQPSCSGPFRTGPYICSYSSSGSAMGVYALEADGCL
jgi:hypothetical protein